MNVLIGIDGLTNCTNNSIKLLYTLLKTLKNNKKVKNLNLIVAQADLIGDIGEQLEKKLDIKPNNIPSYFQKGQGYMNYNLCIMLSATSCQHLTNSGINISPNNIFHLVCDLPNQKLPYIITSIQCPEEYKIKFIAFNKEIKKILLQDFNVISILYKDPNDCLNFIR